MNSKETKTIAVKATKSKGLSKTGIWLSVICAIHCMALPVLAVFLPSISAFLHEKIWLEFALLAGGFGIGVFTVLKGYRIHSNILPASLMIPALALVGAELAEVAGDVHFLLPVGAGLAALSQMINFRIMAQHRQNLHANCDHH